MKKVYEQMLAEFKKSNKARKEVMAKEFGKKSAEELLNFLNTKLKLTKKTEKKAPTPKKVNKPKEIVVDVESSKPLTEIPTSPTVTSEEPEVINDVVIAFDTTGSMSSYINAVKKHVRDLIPELFATKSNLKVSIVAFGDYCDMESVNKFGIAYQCLNLTDNQNDLIKFITNAKNTSGGDGDEFYELVIRKITNETNWRTNSVKSVIFIGDCDPHPVGYNVYINHQFSHVNQLDWYQEAEKAAKLGIQFDTLSIIGRPWYQELSRVTNGLALPFVSSKNTNELIKASTYVRGDKKSKAVFDSLEATAVASGDKEKISMYKTLRSKY